MIMETADRREGREQRARRAPHFLPAYEPDGISPPCRYRHEFAGFPVCRAVTGVAIATGTDCSKCPVPETLERVDCFLLRAGVDLVPEVRVRWTCGATEDPVAPDSPSGCAGCRTSASVLDDDGSAETMY